MKNFAKILTTIPLKPIYLKIGAIAAPALATSVFLTIRHKRQIDDAFLRDSPLKSKWLEELGKLEPTFGGYILKEDTKEGVAYELKEYSSKLSQTVGISEGLTFKMSEEDVSRLNQIEDKMDILIHTLEAFSGPEVDANSSYPEKLLAVNLGFSMVITYDLKMNSLLNQSDRSFEDRVSELEETFKDLRKIGSPIELQVSQKYHDLSKTKLHLDSEFKKSKIKKFKR